MFQCAYDYYLNLPRIPSTLDNRVAPNGHISCSSAREGLLPNRDGLNGFFLLSQERNL